MKRLQFTTSSGMIVEVEEERKKFRILRLPVQRNDSLHLGRGTLSSWKIEAGKPAELVLAKNGIRLQTARVEKIVAV